MFVDLFSENCYFCFSFNQRVQWSRFTTVPNNFIFNAYYSKCCEPECFHFRNSLFMILSRLNPINWFTDSVSHWGVQFIVKKSIGTSTASRIKKREHNFVKMFWNLWFHLFNQKTKLHSGHKKSYFWRKFTFSISLWNCDNFKMGKFINWTWFVNENFHKHIKLLENIDSQSLHFNSGSSGRWWITFFFVLHISNCMKSFSLDFSRRKKNRPKVLSSSNRKSQISVKKRKPNWVKNLAGIQRSFFLNANSNMYM